MRALSNLISVNEPELVLFVGEALVGNDAVDQLTKFNQRLMDLSASSKPHAIDGILLTKFDTIDDKVSCLFHSLWGYRLNATSSSSHAAVVDQAKALRAQRQAARKQEENVQKIQRWWRGNREKRVVQQSLKKAFDEATWADGGITKMRCLVLMGRDEERLGRWSAEVLTINVKDHGKCK